MQKWLVFAVLKTNPTLMWKNELSYTAAVIWTRTDLVFQTRSMDFSVRMLACGDNGSVVKAGRDGACIHFLVHRYCCSNRNVCPT